MTEAQIGLYKFEWGKARRWYRAHGFSPQQADAMRHKLHVKALGSDKSSNDFNNREFDKVLGEFRAVSDGGNLDAQIDQEDQPKKRAAMAIRRIDVLKRHMKIEGGRETFYVQGIAKKQFGTHQYQHLDDIQLAQLEGVIIRRLLQLHSSDRVDEIKHEAAEYAGSVAKIFSPTNSNPF